MWKIIKKQKMSKAAEAVPSAGMSTTTIVLIAIAVLAVGVFLYTNMAPAEAPLAPVDPKLGSAADSSSSSPADSSVVNNTGSAPSTVTDRGGAHVDPLTAILSGGNPTNPIITGNPTIGNRAGAKTLVQDNKRTGAQREVSSSATIISTITNRGGAQRIG